MAIGGGRLPGGFPAWRGWAMVLWRTRFVRPLGVIVFAVLVYTAIFVRSPTDAVPVLVIILAVVVPFSLGYGSFRRLTPGVAADDQLELTRLVADVAARTGVRPPDRIWLTAWWGVSSRVRGRRRELVVGRPLFACLSHVELRALVARELGAMDGRRPWLVSRLRTLWTDSYARTVAEDDRDEQDPPSRTELRRYRAAIRIESALASFGSAVHRRAADAAVRCAGTAEVTAQAYVAEEHVSSAFMYYLIWAGLVGPSAWRDQIVVDVDEGWRQVLADGLLVGSLSEEAVEALAYLHPSLAGALRPLATGHELTRPPDPVSLAPLPMEDQQRLARTVVVVGYESPVWTTFAEAPLSWWERRAGEDAAETRERAAERLGRAAVDDVEVAGNLYAAHADEMPPGTPAGEPPMSLRYLLEDILIPRGWRLVHPAVRGVLVGPAGERVDARDLVGGTMAAPDLSAFAAIITVSGQ